MKLLIALLLITFNVNAQQPILVDPQTGKFLGVYSNNPYDYDSISNQYGPYGNPYGNTVTNTYSEYGNPYSISSPYNQYIINDYDVDLDADWDW